MKVIIQGMAVEYADEGKGRVALFLHGWKDNLHTFDDITSLLSPSLRVIRVDLPGFGESETPATKWALVDYVRFVKALIDKLNINTDVLVGHSLGGRIVVKGVASKGLEVKKIVLISSAGVAQRKTLRNFFFIIVAKVGRVLTSVPPLSFLRQWLRRILYESIGSDYLGAGALRDTFLNIIKENLTSVAKTITMPALIIWGSGDTETPVIDGRRLQSFIRDSSLHILPGAGHFVHKDKPEEVAELIREFTK